MLYTYDNYNFDIVFNSEDFIIQIETNELLYNNVFIFEEIKVENNFLNQSNINKLLVNCFEKKEDYNLEIKHTKIIKLKFCYLSDLSTIELELEILPVRKDLSNNKEIIELKKKIYKLESLIKNYDYNNFIFDNNLTVPINLTCNEPICFSNLNLFSLNIFIRYNHHDRNSSQQHIILNYDPTNKNENRYNYNFIYNVNFERKDEQNSKSKCDTNTKKILNYNVKNVIFTEKFKLLNVPYIIFYDLNINDDIINNLNNMLSEIIFVNCTVELNKINENNFNELTFYNCNVICIDGLKNNNKDLIISLYNCTSVINNSLFSSNVKINNNTITRPLYIFVD